MAQALPAGGKLVTIEVDQKHADVCSISVHRSEFAVDMKLQVAMDNIDKAGLSNKVEVIVGPGVDVLAKLSSTGTLPFDLIFIDADKKSYPAYFQEAKRLVRQGGIIVSFELPFLPHPRCHFMQRFATMWCVMVGPLISQSPTMKMSMVLDKCFQNSSMTKTSMQRLSIRSDPKDMTDFYLLYGCNHWH